MLKADAAIVTIILIGTAFLATYPHVNIPSKNKLLRITGIEVSLAIF